MKKEASVLTLLLSLCLLFSACAGQQSSSTTTQATANSSDNSEAVPGPSSNGLPIGSNSVADTPASWADILPSHHFDESEVEAYALALTDHLLMRTVQGIPQQGQLSEREIFDFVITLCLYHDESNHPYSDIVTIEENPHSYARYSEKAVQLMVYEMFGVSNWQYENNQHDLIGTDSSGNDEYFFPMEAGFPTSPYSYSDLAVVSNDGNLIKVQFDLADTKLWPSSNLDYGKHQITYQLIEENGNAFLRFISFSPVP